MKILRVAVAVIVPFTLSTLAFADGAGFGYNFGNWATGAGGASGTVAMQGSGSIDNTSSSATVAALGGGCNCSNGAIASDASIANNNITVTGGGTSQSATAATSAAGVGFRCGRALLRRPAKLRLHFLSTALTSLILGIREAFYCRSVKRGASFLVERI